MTTRRLVDLLEAMGAPDEIAPTDVTAYARKAGEVIKGASTAPHNSRGPAPSQGTGPLDNYALHGPTRYRLAA
jgi:hypothetical protein